MHQFLNLVFLVITVLIVICIDYKISCSFILEELKLVNYEVDILKTPVKLGEEQSYPMLHMISKYGQRYQCLLPQVEEKDDASEKKEPVAEENADIKELLRPIQSGSCLLKTKDWWTYEFCFGHYIKQYHIEDGKILGQVITLGLYESDYDWDNETDQDKFSHVKLRYHSQTYANGSKCDLTGLSRNAEVRFFCEEDAGDYIFRVDEPGTCSYVLTIHTSRICSHPQLKPLPSNKAHSISCSPLLNEEQYTEYLHKVDAEKTVAEEKRSQWLTNQQERLKVMKSWAKESFINLEGEEMEKLGAVSDMDKETGNEIPKSSEFTGSKDMQDGETVVLLRSVADKPTLEGNDLVEKMLLQEYDQEIEKLKSSIPPERFASVKDDIQKQFDSILNEAEEEFDPDMSDETKDAAFSKLASTLRMLLDKLDKAEKDVAKATEELVKVQSVITTKKIEESALDEEHDIDDDQIVTLEESLKMESQNIAGKLKVIEDEQTQTAVLDDDKLHVRIRRLDRKSPDANGKLHEMDFAQRKKLEQAVKEKLEKAGLDTGGRRIEVKIITAGYYDNEDGKDFHSLSDDETSQFQNMIMALLTGQQEAIQEMEKHKKLEENYKFVWSEGQTKNEDD